MTDDRPADDRVREVLSSEVYERAFAKGMAGDEALLEDDERAAVREARELTGTPGVGFPAPWRLDATRRDR